MHVTPRLLLLVLFVGTTSCQQSARTEPDSAASAASAIASTAPSIQSPILKLGQTAQLPAYTAKLVSQRVCRDVHDGSTRRAMRSWAAELEITSLTTERLAVNPFSVTLQDDQGFSYRTSLVGCTPLLPAKLLEPQGTTRGYVPFELPLATTTVTLTLSPWFGADRAQVARFRLEL